jgi:hypothetical protein
MDFAEGIEGLFLAGAGMMGCGNGLCYVWHPSQPENGHLPGMDSA